MPNMGAFFRVWEVIIYVAITTRVIGLCSTA